ncbi:MAG: AbrB/MazE/SpoVT family DNA-binding domain-containing protein [Planctomycetales bacterium]|nr:AbrB/MazE/SpoVT family DNA-binding domain-containing protein [Planctomycetales bacterium]
MPSELRDRLGLEEGSAVVVVQDERGVHIETPEQALDSLRAYFKGLIPPGVSLVDELIAERRAEAKRD